MTTKKTILNWLAHDNLGRVLKGLNLLADRYKDEQLRNDATFQSGRLKTLEIQRIKNTISSDDDRKETAKIREALLLITNNLSNDWIAEEIENDFNSFSAEEVNSLITQAIELAHKYEHEDAFNILSELELKGVKLSVKGYNALGWMYASGKGTARNFDRAIQVLLKPANSGYSESQFILGWIYYQLDIDTHDDEKSMMWFRKAAEQGHVEAQYNLAIMYMKGRGVKSDCDTAKYWFQKAALQGHQDAKDQLNNPFFRVQGVIDFFRR